MKKNNIKGGHMMDRLFYRFKRGVEPMKRVLIYGLVAQLAFPVPPAFALPIEVDPSNPMTNAPTLDKAQNGVDIVNIANPTRAGVSANKFRDYNVPVSGVIMNNSLAIARSQLGGVINANQQLVDGQSADLVLFQVTGVGESQLRGYSEMHGASADFILANPNGISINGGGFIGTPRVTLTTGVPGFNSMGGIDDISVSQGAIRIDGDGFNASNVDYVSIWARTMALHGAYYAKHADIKLGTNDIDYATGAMTVLTDGNGEPSAFALDASALGAMHADSIALVSTEDGVGVRSRADIVAQSGELTLQSNGQLVVHHIQAKGDATLVAAGDIEQTGASYSAQTLRMESASDIALRGESVSAAQQVLVTANGDVVLEKTASLGNESPFLVATSAAISGDDVRLASADVMVMDTLDVDANGQLTIESSQLVARSQAVSAEAMAALDSDVVGGAISVDVANELTLDGMVVSMGDLGISAGRMQQSGVIFSALDTTVMVDDVLVNEGDILAGGTLTVHDREGGKAQRVVNAQGVMEAEGDVLIRANEIHNIGVVETEMSTDVSGQDWDYPTSKRKQLHTLRSVMRVKMEPIFRR